MRAGLHELELCLESSSMAESAGFVQGAGVAWLSKSGNAGSEGFDFRGSERARVVGLDC